jgi:hypothetical protein
VRLISWTLRSGSEQCILPADIARVIEKCCQDLGRRVALREMSNEMKKEKEPERLLQLEGLQAQVSKYAIAKDKGNMADLMRVKQALPPLLKKYLEDLKANERGGLSPDTTEKWRQTALDLTGEAMKYVSKLGTHPGSAPEGVLGPLRRAIGKVATLGEAVTKGVQEPDEEELRDLAKRLGAVKKELMAVGRDLMVNQPADTATEAHELISEAGEAIKANREIIKAALRGPGAASDISEVSSLVVPPQPPPARPSMGNLAAPAWPPRGNPAAPAWPTQGNRTPPAWPPQGNPAAPQDVPPRPTPMSTGDELANLMQGLMGAQANDSGWPTFSGKYADTPASRRSGGLTGARTMGT